MAFILIAGPWGVLGKGGQGEGSWHGLHVVANEGESKMERRDMRVGW